MGKKQDPESCDSQDETLPGDEPGAETGLAPEVEALTDHSELAPVPLERDTVRDGVFVNLGRAFDSTPRSEVREQPVNETENNRTLQYVSPGDLDKLEAADGSLSSERPPKWNKRQLPLTPKKRVEGPARTKRRSPTAAPTATEPVVKFRTTPKK